MTSAVAIGGGTGTSCVISALKKIPHVQPCAIVGMADSGGSTGRLRDEFGFPPVGDVRQSLAALAEDEGQHFIRNMLLYRFEKGHGLRGHSLGNLLLTALQDMTGGTGAALSAAESIFRLRGKVYPATEDVVELEIEYQDGTRLVGEHNLDDLETGNKPIRGIRLLPRATAYPPAIGAVQNADYIVIGPGDYYASLVSALLVEGVTDALRETTAHVFLVMNIMSRFTQTDGWSASRYVQGIERLIGRPLDGVLVHRGSYSAETLKLYAAVREYPVADDLGDDSRVWREDLIEDVAYRQSSADAVQRSVLRHSPQKLARLLERMMSSV